MQQLLHIAIPDAFRQIAETAHGHYDIAWDTTSQHNHTIRAILVSVYIKSRSINSKRRMPSRKLAPSLVLIVVKNFRNKKSPLASEAHARRALLK